MGNIRPKKLTWEEEPCLAQEPVEDLPEEDALELLQHYGISDEKIRARIVEGSCVPYYLVLSVDTHQQISKQRQPEVDDFAKTRKEVFTCFVRHLTKAEIEMMKVLSSARFWDEGYSNC